MENIIVPSKYMETFDKLNNGRNTTRILRELSIWPDWAPDGKIAVGANDFWKLSDLLTTVEGLNGEPYKSTITLDNVVRAYTPNKLKEKNPERMSKLASEHFRVVDDKNFDAEVSRFAAWALVKEIGKGKPTIFHQEYFMTPNSHTTVIDLYKLTNQTARIDLREDVKKYQKQLNGIMNKLHAHDKHYAELNREMVKWLFGNLNSGDIRYEYRLPENKPLADFMNVHLLFAYRNALKNIIHKWDFDAPAREYGVLRGIVYNEMIAAREEMKRKFGNPEKSFDTISVDEVTKWHNKREFEFAKKYINVKVR